jgi:hypothetical protein
VRSRLTSFASAAVLALAVSAAAAEPPRRAVPPPCVEPVLPCAERPAPGRDDLSAYEGLGTWLDAYDWAPEYGGRVRPSALDEMQRRGVRTIYLQASKAGSRWDGQLLSPQLLAQWLVGAHERGMQVQAWYLPPLTDLDVDRASLDAIVGFDVEGHRFDTVGLDIEWRGVRDVEERNRRLVALSTELRASAPDLPLAGIVVAPVVTHDVNKQYWSPFPWDELAPLFDVWQPMGYWTDRKRTSRWRDAHESTVWNTRYLREALEDPEAPVHVIGGIGATETEARGFVRAAGEERVLGGSLYDWPHTPSNVYDELQGLPGQSR